MREQVQSDRWGEISPSQFEHEKLGLDFVKDLLPDAPRFRAWSNFEFRDNRGRWHEVDLLVLSRDTLYLIELKYYSGTLRGGDHVWSRGGYRSEDSPLLLTRKKAQYFSSLLKDAESRAARVGERPARLRELERPSTGAGTRRVPGDPSAAARSDPSCSASNPPSDHTSSVAPTVCSATECARS